MMSDHAGTPDSSAIGAAISEDLLQIHGETYGVGDAATAKTHITNDSVICFLDDLALEPAEAFMIDHGEQELVLAMRRGFQSAVEPSFRAAVERATGREVTHFFSATALDPLFSIELFRLAPARPQVAG